MSVRSLRRGSLAASGGESAPPAGDVLYLTMTSPDYISTPDSAENSITGDFDFRIKAVTAAWIGGTGQYLTSKWADSWILALTNDGYLEFLTGGGIDAWSTVPHGLVNNTVSWVRVTWRASDGRTQFFKSADGSSWTQIGANVTAAGSIPDSAAALKIGELFIGSIYYAELRNGIDGTVVQSFDPTGVTKAGTRDPSSVAAGGPWTINGSAWDWVT